jgi:hypothetical protein
LSKFFSSFIQRILFPSNPVEASSLLLCLLPQPGINPTHHRYPSRKYGYESTSFNMAQSKRRFLPIMECPNCGKFCVKRLVSGTNLNLGWIFYKCENYQTVRLELIFKFIINFFSYNWFFLFHFCFWSKLELPFTLVPNWKFLSLQLSKRKIITHCFLYSHWIRNIYEAQIKNHNLTSTWKL